MLLSLLSLDSQGRSNVMIPEALDPALDILGFYDQLPNVGQVCPVTSEDRTASSTCVTSYTEVASALNSSTASRIRAAKRFEQHAPYINLARVDLDATYIENVDLMVSGTRDFAVCLMTGIVRWCDLGVSANPDESGARTVCLEPFWDDIRRECAYLSARYRMNGFHTHIDARGVRFSTRHADSASGDMLNSALMYYDEVPVYDAREDRATFWFTSADFVQLENWSLYEADDIAIGSIATVGYTVSRGSTFHNDNTIERHLQSLLLLADV